MGYLTETNEWKDWWRIKSASNETLIRSFRGICTKSSWDGVANEEIK